MFWNIFGWVRAVFKIAPCFVVWVVILAWIALLAFVMLQDVIEAARECRTFNVIGNCVENKLRNL